MMTFGTILRTVGRVGAVPALLALCAALAGLRPAPGAGRQGEGMDWPMFGGAPSRNLVNPVARNIPDDWSVKKGKEKNVKWVARLGTMAYGGPVVSGGKVFVGTNNEKPRNAKVTGDKGILMCFRESDGQLLWQAVHDKLPNPEENDTVRHGVASSPCVEGNRLWYVSNRAEVVCADTEGDPTTGQAKILWTYDMIKELGVYPCYLANSSPLVLGDLVFAVTANGVQPGSSPLKIPAPDAPSFVALHKKTGKLAWKDSSPGKNLMEGQWGSPCGAQIDGKWQVVFPGGDGWLYAFEPETGKLLWKFDCNPKKSVFKPGGRGDRAYLIATPVVWEKKLYIATGSDPEDGQGVGHLWCIDLVKATAKGQTNKDHEVSPVNDNFDPKAPVNKDSALLWHHGGSVVPRPEDGREWHFSRTLSTCAVQDGLVYAAELMGYLQCLDANTGKKYWEYDFQDSTWSSPFVADGKVFMGTDSGDMYLFATGKTAKLIRKINMEQSLKVPPVVANGILFVNNGLNLYAIAGK